MSSRRQRRSMKLSSMTIQIKLLCLFYITLTHAQMSLQPHEVEMRSPPSKKRKTLKKTQPTLPSPCVTGHAQFHIRLKITRFYFSYMETNRQLIWIVMAPGRQCMFHVPLLPSEAHKLLPQLKADDQTSG